jgi:hypothetical protein
VQSDLPTAMGDVDDCELSVGRVDEGSSEAVDQGCVRDTARSVSGCELMS